MMLFLLLFAWIFFYIIMLKCVCCFVWGLMAYVRVFILAIDLDCLLACDCDWKFFLNLFQSILSI